MMELIIFWIPIVLMILIAIELAIILSQRPSGRRKPSR